MAVLLRWVSLKLSVTDKPYRLSVVMLKVVMLSAIMLSVMAPQRFDYKMHTNMPLTIHLYYL
jgi:hypothetical protein